MNSLINVRGVFRKGGKQRFTCGAGVREPTPTHAHALTHTHAADTRPDTRPHAVLVVLFTISLFCPAACGLFIWKTVPIC